MLASLYDGITQNEAANSTLGAAGDLASEMGEMASEAALGEN